LGWEEERRGVERTGCEDGFTEVRESGSEGKRREGRGSFDEAAKLQMRDERSLAGMGACETIERLMERVGQRRDADGVVSRGGGGWMSLSLSIE
jgi:hypothetical protein